MLEKVITYGLPILGIIIGCNIGELASNPADSALTHGLKVVGGGVIFGIEGIDASKSALEYIAQSKGGDA